MTSLSKKQQKIREKIKPNYLYSATDAIELLKEFASTKFKQGESVDLCCNLGVDPRKSDQVVRFATNLPKGTGKTVRVAVFAQGDSATKAKEAGADQVGLDDLADLIKAGEINFDVVIASPDTMHIVGKLGQILGPRGLMPNPKVGTVTPNVAEAVKNAKSGQVRCRTDKNGIVHVSVGNINFPADDLLVNIAAFIADLRKAKPASSKGVYVKKISLTTTMGPGLPIDIASIPV